MRKCPLVLIVILAGCTKTSIPTPIAPPEEPTPIRVDESANQAPSGIEENFVFEVRDYNWELGGSEIVSVAKSGMVTYVFPKMRMVIRKKKQVGTVDWYRADFQISQQDRDALRRKLDEAKFFSLEKKYINGEIDDGEHSTFLVGSGTQTHRVECSNQYPPALTELMRWINATMLPHYQEATKEAKLLSVEENEALQNPTP